MQEREQLITDIIREEFRQFDQVNNQGGRAYCQDDWETFQIMRRSQYSLWPDALLESYLADLLDAAKFKRNLIMEKYGRMMESTAPEQYEKIKGWFPYRSPIRLKRQETIIAQEVAWNEAFCAKYPNYAGRGRRIHTSEDTPWATSTETYTRGEMSTWSDATFELYEKWFHSLVAEGKNLAQMTAENMVRLYGYESVEQAEAQLARKK